jgi:hypothetical protein
LLNSPLVREIWLSVQFLLLHRQDKPITGAFDGLNSPLLRQITHLGGRYFPASARPFMDCKHSGIDRRQQSEKHNVVLVLLSMQSLGLLRPPKRKLAGGKKFEQGEE